MKNKYVLISKVIGNLFIVLLLFWIFFSNLGIAKLLVIPFITCGLFSIGKNICTLMNKKRYADIFNKLFIISFLIFWFCFLIFWSYLVIKENNYFAVLLTIPFWVVGIYVFRKYLLGLKSKSLNKSNKLKFNFKIIVSSFLVIVILLVGLFCLFIGIKDTYKLNKTTKNYIKTNAHFIDYEIYNPSSNSKNYKEETYILNYLYEVEGMKYIVSTDYGVRDIPKKNSIREIKYNQNNPEESIIVGINRNNSLIYFGVFFTFGSIAFILGALYIKGIFDKVKIDIVGLYLGFVFLITGVGLISLKSGTDLSFYETIEKLGAWSIIPVLFIIVGIFQIIKCLFFKLFSVNKNG